MDNKTEPRDAGRREGGCCLALALQCASPALSNPSSGPQAEGKLLRGELVKRNTQKSSASTVREGCWATGR